MSEPAGRLASSYGIGGMQPPWCHRWDGHVETYRLSSQTGHLEIRSSGASERVQEVDPRWPPSLMICSLGSTRCEIRSDIPRAVL